MASTPLALSAQTGWTETDHPRGGSPLNTGDLRRKYNFGDRLSELAIAQDPFFRLVSKVAKSPTDDPEFKFTEKRNSFHKRYGYVIGYIDSGDSAVTGNATLLSTDDNVTNVANNEDVSILVSADYKSAGNIGSRIGNAVTVGADGTQPRFFLANQIVRVPLSATSGGTYGTPTDYALIHVTAVDTSQADVGSKECVRLTGKCIRQPASGVDELSSFEDATTFSTSLGMSTSVGPADLASKQCNIVGTSYEEGSSLLGATWDDQPYSTGSGLVQTFRDEFGMTNKARATVLKYDPNEFARVWREHLIAHKWDIEQAALWGAQSKKTIGSNEYWYTQGASDYILSYGNIFSLTHASKTADDFLEDMSKFLDPRYNSANATVFFCDTATYNWMHKLSGYFANNVGMVIPGGSSPGVTSLGRADFAVSGKRKVFGVDITTISTPYGDMNVARNVHLDGSDIKIMGINMRYVKYRPLVGNGVNRDTSVYVGVQSLETSGVDKRTDMILTEAGFEWSMPEAHVVWK